MTPPRILLKAPFPDTKKCARGLHGFVAPRGVRLNAPRAQTSETLGAPNVRRLFPFRRGHETSRGVRFGFVSGSSHGLVGVTGVGGVGWVGVKEQLSILKAVSPQERSCAKYFSTSLVERLSLVGCPLPTVSEVNRFRSIYVEVNIF